MKKIFGLMVLLSVATTSAEEIRVRKMHPDRDMERSFVLETNLKEKVVIDCQSFIQGLRIGEFEAAYTYLLDEEACVGLQSRINHSLQRRQDHCIDVEQDIRADYSCQ